MRFGILCNGHSLQQWQLETVQILLYEGHTLELLIINAYNPQKISFPGKLGNYPYSKLFVRFWMRYLLKQEAKKEVSIDSLASEFNEIDCVTTKKGYSEYFSAADISYIRSFNLDFILRFGFSIIKGEILQAAKHGIWSYHHDDDKKYRGVPTGFWEILFNDPVNAAVLQRLTDELDAGIILRKAYFSTIKHSWQANLDNLLKSTTEWPSQVCRDIGNGVFTPVEDDRPTEKIYKLPGNLKMFQFALKLAANKFRFHFRDLCITEKWNIGIIPQSIERILKPGLTEIPEPVWLPLSSSRSIYHADGTGFISNTKLWILCEEYDYRKGVGHLTSFLLESDLHHVAKKTTALQKPYHLAFPFVFEYKGKHFCIPENAEGGNIDLYEVEENSGRLLFVQTLIPGLKAIDPVLFFKDQNWWLFFTDTLSTNERLHIWYAEDLLGPYKPHANNPVKTDVRSSRPAGRLFYYGEILLRPVQDSSMRSGRRIILNQVVKLNPLEFVETQYAALNPAQDSKFGLGMHTFNVSDNLIVVDGKREIFIWQALLKKLKLKMNKILKR